MLCFSKQSKKPRLEKKPQAARACYTMPKERRLHPMDCRGTAKDIERMRQQLAKDKKALTFLADEDCIVSVVFGMRVSVGVTIVLTVPRVAASYKPKLFSCGA